MMTREDYWELMDQFYQVRENQITLMYALAEILRPRIGGEGAARTILMCAEAERNTLDREALEKR